MTYFTAIFFIQNVYNFFEVNYTLGRKYALYIHQNRLAASA